MDKKTLLKNLTMLQQDAMDWDDETDFITIKSAIEYIKSENQEKPKIQVDPIVGLREKAIMEIASEEQDVIREYADRQIYRDGALEGLRLARIIINETLDWQ